MESEAGADDTMARSVVSVRSTILMGISRKAAPPVSSISSK
jgi:hypothetical protein